MQETIIFALIERAQFAVNPAVYSKEPNLLLGLGDTPGVADNRVDGRVSPHNIPRLIPLETSTLALLPLPAR